MNYRNIEAYQGITNAVLTTAHARVGYVFEFYLRQPLVLAG